MQRFLSRFWPTLAVLLVLAVSFGVYVGSEKQIDRANDQRHLSLILANQLRQSSDDLTRLARTYVVTGDPRFKKYYRDILDIRNGINPRPAGYFHAYWDLVLADVPMSRAADGPAVALLDLMRQAGFAELEMQKMAEAKANSDGLAYIELEAMKLVESAGPDAAANRSRALLMMHDAGYHQAKAAIMKPINESYLLMEQRTADEVQAAERTALLFRILFIACFVGALAMLWRAYEALRTTLGGSAAEVLENIHRIGRGDFSSVVTIDSGMGNSVLAGLAEMQAKLMAHEVEREAANTALRLSEQLFSTAFSSCPVAASIATAVDGRFIEANANFERDFGWTPADLIGRTSVEVGIWPDQLTRQPWADAIRHKGRLVDHETVWVHKNGQRRNVSLSAEITELNGQTCILAYATDITSRKEAEATLSIAAAAFESQEGTLVTDASGIIQRVNKAFTSSTGYAAEEAIGQKPSILKSGRHDDAFYAAMWESLNTTGTWQGEVWDRRKNGEVYPKWLTISAVKGGDGKVAHYVGTHHDITERKRNEEKINELAFFDALTRLPNRTLLMDRLKQMMTASNRNGSCGAVLFIDLDNFKTLNDTLGHDKGDLLLQQVAQRLVASVREGDTVARLGGDEFVLVLGNLSENLEEAANQTEVVGEKILAALDQVYPLGDIEFRSTASIGATLFRGHETSLDDLLRQADLAMYKSKETGRNALNFFDLDMQTVVVERAALEASLRKAIEGHQFVLHYQAQVTADGRVTGGEALVRWRHPERGMVSPGEFIPLAEETGLILPLGQWVLETACTQLARWAERPEMAQLKVAVNVSAHQFRESDFVQKVLATISQSGANPSRLKLELTESLLVDNVEDIIDKMTALKARGVHFSLDDFGTGYSSLSYLKRLPLDQLKIDQSFVRDVLVDPNDAAIARTIVALAQSLGLGVIAEGVETQAQREFLASSGCHAYQGYLFSRPLPPEGFEEFVGQTGTNADMF